MSEYIFKNKKPSFDSFRKDPDPLYVKGLVPPEDLWGMGYGFLKRDEQGNLTVEGVKHDEGKPRLDLIPPEAIMALGEVLQFGAETEGYEDRNWEKGLDWGRVYGAAQRHLQKWALRQNKDEKSGKSHLWHALANIAFLIAYEQRGIGKDTRTMGGNITK